MGLNFNVRQALVVLAYGCILLSACGPGRRAAKNRVQLDTLTVTAKNNPLNIYRASSPKTWEIVNTRVALSFNYKEKTAEGKAWIKLRPYFYETDTLVLDVKSMVIDSISVHINGNLSMIGAGKDFRASNRLIDILKFKLKQKCKPSDDVDVFVKYTAMPYTGKSGGSGAINDDKGLYFINTDNAIPNKPVQVWTQGETESNSHWVPTIDKPNQRTTVQIELTVADSFTTLSNGYLYKQEPAGSGMRTDTWIMDKSIQVYAMMFAIGKFSIVKDKEALGKEISYYVEPEYAPYAKDMFRNTPEMVEYFSQVTGLPYAWNKYSQVVVRDYVSGAMENTSATLLGEFLNQNKREVDDQGNEDVVSHELFHQWFGDYVTAESWSNLTLNESFATYGEELWRMHKYGKAAADNLFWTELSTYLNSGESGLNLVRYYYSDKEDMFDRVSYQKGACILHYLHGLMGDEAFSKSMQLYLTRNALHSAEASQWRLAIEEITGQDWNWFFNQWYYKSGHPRLEIKYNYDDAAQKLIVTIAQKQEGSVYHLPLKTAIVYGQNTKVEDWDIADRTTTLTYPYQNGVKPLIVPDVKHWLVGEMVEDKKPAGWLATFKASNDDVIDRLKAVRSIRKKWDDTANIAIVDAALQDKDYFIRLDVLQELRGLTISKLKDKWTRDVLYIADNDGNNKVRAAAFDVLGDWNVKSANKEMLTALSDSSYKVAGAALAALSKTNTSTDSIYNIAKQMMQHDPRGDLKGAIWDVIGKTAKEGDINLFEQRAVYFYGNEKIALASSLDLYLQNVASPNSFERGLKVFTGMFNSEMISSYRVAVASYLVSTATYYKDKKKTARNNPDQTQAENRLAMIKPVLDQMIARETDEDHKRTISNYTKAVYGN